MNMKLKIVANLFLLLLSLLVSCTPSGKSPPILLEDKYVNQQILVRAPNYSNTYNVGDSISLELKYNSKYEIVFPNDYNLRIFEDTGDGWVEIKQKPTQRIPSGDIVLFPTAELPAVQIVILFPDLPDLQRKYLLRIYVIGQMKIDGDLVKVAAYTQIALHP